MVKVALVTGGTRGIGAAIAKLISRAGYRTAVTYASNDKAASDFTDGTNIKAYKWDTGNYEECTEGVSRVEQALGPVDILVNNAGITNDAFLHKMTPEQWTSVITTNLAGIFNMTRPVIGGMRKRKFGRIVIISSINGQKGQIGQTNYSAAKAGAIGFMKALAQESASVGITVNAVCPGYIDTDMFKSVQPAQKERIVSQIPLGRLGTADEIARAVLFLISDEAGFITGSSLSINGGQYMI